MLQISPKCAVFAFSFIFSVLLMLGVERPESQEQQRRLPNGCRSRCSIGIGYGRSDQRPGCLRSRPFFDGRCKSIYGVNICSPRHSSNLSVLINSFCRALETIRDIMIEQATRSTLTRVFNHLADIENINKCKEMIDYSVRRFQVQI